MGVPSLVCSGGRPTISLSSVSLWKSWPVREERHDRANGPGPARSGVGSRLRSLLSRAERLLSLKSFQHMSDATIACGPHGARTRTPGKGCTHATGERCAALGSSRSVAAPRRRRALGPRGLCRTCLCPAAQGRDSRVAHGPSSVRRVCHKRIELARMDRWHGPGWSWCVGFLRVRAGRSVVCQSGAAVLLLESRY